MHVYIIYIHIYLYTYNLCFPVECIFMRFLTRTKADKQASQSSASDHVGIFELTQSHLSAV